MTAQTGVTIALALWSTFGTFAILLLNRRLRRKDAFELKCEEFVTRDELKTSLKGLSDEGIAREERITDAIDRLNLNVGSEVRELRNEIRIERTESARQLSEQRLRVDEIMRLDRGGGFRRT